MLHLIHKLKGIKSIPVHLIEKSKYRYPAAGHNLEELPGLRLHALGGIYHHDRIVRCHEGAVGILREVLMPRRIQDVNALITVLKLQHGGRNGYSSFLLDIHPVGYRMPCRRLTLYRSRGIELPPVQQEFLGKRGFSCVGVRDYGESPPFIYFI